MAVKTEGGGKFEKKYQSTPQEADVAYTVRVHQQVMQ